MTNGRIVNGTRYKNAGWAVFDNSETVVALQCALQCALDQCSSLSTDGAF